MLVPGVFVVVMVIASTTLQDVQALDSVLSRYASWDFLKDLFQFHIYVNPHPACALEAEPCTLDNNCCTGLECKVYVDRNGLKYTCQPRVNDGKDESTMEEADAEVFWGFGPQDSAASSGETKRNIFRSRLENAERDEEKLVKDQNYIIKELQNPLTFDELRNLQMEKQLQDFRRERELKGLRNWLKSRDANETAKEENIKGLKKIAKERVEKVLREEERQKQDLLNSIQNVIIKR